MSGQNGSGPIPTTLRRIKTQVYMPVDSANAQIMAKNVLAEIGFANNIGKASQIDTMARIIIFASIQLLISKKNKKGPPHKVWLSVLAKDLECALGQGKPMACWYFEGKNGVQMCKLGRAIQAVCRQLGVPAPKDPTDVIRRSREDLPTDWKRIDYAHKYRNKKAKIK